MLIAGKGADAFQLVGSKKKKFDDCEVARAWLYSGGGKEAKDFSVVRPQLRIAPHTI